MLPGPCSSGSCRACRLDLAIGNLERQRCEQCGDAALAQCTAIDAFDRDQRGRGDVHLDPPATARVKAVADQPRLDGRPHAVDDRQERLRDELERRGEHVVRAAFEDQARRRIGEDERHQQRLEDQAGAARRADGKAIFAGHHLARREGDVGRADRKAVARRTAQRARGLDRSDMLAHQPRLGALAARIDDAEGLAGDQRQRARIAHHLSPAFALRPVDDDHVSRYP
jgi:hypothetical protein